MPEMMIRTILPGYLKSIAMKDSFSLCKTQGKDVRIECLSDWDCKCRNYLYKNKDCATKIENTYKPLFFLPHRPVQLLNAPPATSLKIGDIYHK